ncbi:MAG: hypothetical protein DME69_08335 [Verrucomicrobia bacterium]|nr:MAG: hypothetical protein DME69_08335 [Verrucomicrobiota bacterium]
MKKKSASQSAFFNLRVLIGLFVVLAGVFLALAGFGTFSALAQAQQKNKIITNSKNPLVPNGFDCSKIHELGIDKQENFRAGAIMIACGQAQGGSASVFETVSQAIQKTLAPLAYGAADVDLVTGAESSPHITQSETFSWANPDNPNQIVVAYNDSRGVFANPINISGASVSTDGGATFVRLTATNGQSPFQNTLGDPVALFNKPSQTWFAIFLDPACGGQGIGGYKSTTPSDPNSWTHFCVHTGFADDRESGWADNNTSSPFFGRMYVSWNDFGRGEGLFVRFSTDNGATWTNERQLASGSPFIRDVQITGDLATGDVYVAGMNEGGGGFPHNDNNLMFRSTDGGNTWTNTFTGPSFPGPGVTTCPNAYFACMFTDTGGYWRHEGWGEPAAFNHVVSYVYAAHGAGSDPGDVYYIRSTDSGVTFGTPFKLNTDSTTRPQWQPNLSVSPAGTLFAMWYDARESTSCTKGNPAVPCYRMWARKSNDNGLTWLADDTFSDVVTPLPGQPDPGIIAEYAGDYDYGSAILTKHVSSWDDGRVPIAGASQQDAFTDRELVGFSVTTTDPACNSVVFTQPTDFIVNLSDPALPSSVQATDFTVNNIPANSFTLSNSNQTITFHYTSTPVTTQGPQTMHISAGAILRNSDSMPIFDFTCTFCYAITPLQVTTTVPPVGGTFSPPAPNNYTYDVNFNQAVDPNSVQTSDLTVTGNSGPSVTAVSVINGNTTARFTLHMDFGGDLTASIAAGAITAQGCNPNAAFSGNYTVEGPIHCVWSAGPDMPSVDVRTVGVFFPTNGKLYGMGGRSSDSAGTEFTNPFEYDPGTNTWTFKSATYPDIQVNNMACGVLNESGTDYIYCVGGSAISIPNAATDRVFRYNPVTDTLTTVAAPWPGSMGTTLPGGFSVFNNKLYILGGFDIPGGNGTAQIWEFTPTTNVWVQKSAVLPVPLGYIPTTTIGSLIYTGGGSDITGGILTDTTNSFKYDPVGDSITTIASIPRATGETRALDFNGQMLVMGGGRTAPNPSNEVDAYNPGSNSWTVNMPVPAFTTARRNFPTDTDGATRIWLAGGYAPTSPTASMEIFNCASPTPTPTPTVTPTPTPTPGQIHLTAKEHIVNGNDVVRLRWTGANSPRVDIRRDGVKIATVANTGSYTDVLTVHGIYTYQVCEAGTRNCSNEVRVRFLR